MRENNSLSKARSRWTPDLLSRTAYGHSKNIPCDIWSYCKPAFLILCPVSGYGQRENSSPFFFLTHLM